MVGLAPRQIYALCVCFLACETTFSAKMPAFNRRSQDEDLFSALGPLPSFSGERTWSPPRTVLVLRVKGTFGLFVRGSQPVIVTGVDEKGPAEVRPGEGSGL